MMMMMIIIIIIIKDKTIPLTGLDRS